MAARDQRIAQRINRETVVLLGWGRAILLQLAHPLVAAGVADYSRFRQGAGGYVRRARETVGAMLAITFGTDQEAEAAVAGINRIHDRVHGTLREPVGPFPAGTPYSAHDPRLLLWVHATLLESMVIAYERLVAPLTIEDKDRYAREATWLTERLGVPARDLPQTYPDLLAYLDRQYASGEIVVGPAARELGEALLSPSIGPAALAFGAARLLTLGLLPPGVRAQYGDDWSPSRERMFRRLVAFIRRTRHLLPGLVTEWPSARRAA
jgi:uncharacterized protein (DUF2236 family)